MDASISDNHVASLDGGPLDGARHVVQESTCWIDVVSFDFRSGAAWGVYVRVSRDRFAWRTWSELRGVELEWARESITARSALSPFDYRRLLDAALDRRAAA